jgi:hypothetical protein
VASLKDNTRTSDVWSKIRTIFEVDLGIRPSNMGLFKDPEDGEEKIIVQVPLGATSDPLKDILSIKRKLREINRELAEKIVVLPSD